jgi:hypothetical protein
VRYTVPNLRFTVTVDSVSAHSKKQDAFLFPVYAMFRHNCPLTLKPASTPRRLVHKKKTWRDSLPIDMLLSAVSVLVVAQRVWNFQGYLRITLHIETALSKYRLKFCEKMSLYLCEISEERYVVRHQHRFPYLTLWQQPAMASLVVLHKHKKISLSK